MSLQRAAQTFEAQLSLNVLVAVAEQRLSHSNAPSVTLRMG